MAGKQNRKNAAQHESPVHHTAVEEMNSVNSSRTLFEQTEAWFKKHITWVFCILVLGWAGLRVSYYHSIIKSPLYSYYLLSESDNKFFDDWAKYLNMDWLNAKPLHPYHSWHKDFADHYFRDHPDKLNGIRAAANGNDTLPDPGKVLWYEWYHGNQYHQEPLYPYILAVFYYFHFDEVNAMIILQLALGVLSGVMLFLITRKYFGATTAVIAGIMYFFCGILMYNEIILLRTSWIVFLTMLAVAAMDLVFSNPKPLRSFLCGLCIGLCFLMQSTFFLYLPGILLITFFVRRQGMVHYLKQSCLLLLGFFIMFSPVIARNIAVGAPTFSISSVGPADIISSNVYGTESVSGWSPSAEREAELIANSNANLIKATFATIKTYPSLLPYLSLEWEKLKAAWTGIEYPNNENYYFYRRFIPVLGWTRLGFFWIAPLGLAGLIFCIYQRKKYYAFYLAIAIQLIALLTIFVLARFRAPLVILLLPFAGYAIVECFRIKNTKRIIGYAKIGVVVLLIGLSFSGYRNTIEDETIGVNNYAALYFTYFNDKIAACKANKQWDNCLNLLTRYIDMGPDYVSMEANGSSLTSINQIQILKIFVEMHKERKRIYVILNDTGKVAIENDIIGSLMLLGSKSVQKMNNS